MLPLKDSGERFGLVSILVHWSSAALIVALLTLGAMTYPLERGPERSALLDWHVSLGASLIPIHILRLAWRRRYGKPATAHDRPLFKFLADIVWRLLLVLVTVQLVTGPLLVWLHDRDISWFGIIAVPPPFAMDESLHERLFGPIHLGSGILLALFILLHVMGALKHLLIDRDGVVGRMFGIRQKGAVPPGETRS